MRSVSKDGETSELPALGFGLPIRTGTCLSPQKIPLYLIEPGFCGKLLAGGVYSRIGVNSPFLISSSILGISCLAFSINCAAPNAPKVYAGK